MQTVKVDVDNIREVYEVYFKKNGKKVGQILNSKAEVTKKRNALKRLHRRFMGYRKLKLVEIV